MLLRLDDILATCGMVEIFMSSFVHVVLPFYMADKGEILRKFVLHG